MTGAEILTSRPAKVAGLGAVAIMAVVPGRSVWQSFHKPQIDPLVNAEYVPVNCNNLPDFGENIPKMALADFYQVDNLQKSINTTACNTANFIGAIVKADLDREPDAFSFSPAGNGPGNYDLMINTTEGPNIDLGYSLSARNKMQINSVSVGDMNNTPGGSIGIILEAAGVANVWDLSTGGSFANSANSFTQGSDAQIIQDTQEASIYTTGYSELLYQDVVKVVKSGEGEVS